MEKWLGKFRQRFKRNFRASSEALRALANWSFHVEEEVSRCQEAAQEIECGIQSQGCFGRSSRRQDVGTALRRISGAQHPNQDWKRLLIERAAGAFASGAETDRQPVVDVAPLHAKIGELTLENDFLERALTRA